MNRRDWDKLKKDLENGIYKMIRLVQIFPDGEPRVIITYNKFTKTGELINRFNYIRNKVDSGQLPPGDYELNLRVSPTNNTMVDILKFSIKPKSVVLNDNTIVDKTSEQETEDMNNVDFDDYVALIKANAELKATNTYLIQELEFYKRELKFYQDNRSSNMPATLQDAPQEKSVAEIITNTLGDTFASAVPILDKYFDLQTRRLDLEEKKITTNTPTKPKAKKMAKSIEEIAELTADELYDLEESDPDEFNRRLDDLEAKNPELYDMVCEILGIEIEEEEDQEEEQE